MPYCWATLISASSPAGDSSQHEQRDERKFDMKSTSERAAVRNATALDMSSIAASTGR